MKFPAGRKLMPNYASSLSPPLTLRWNKCFVHMKHVQTFGHRPSCYTPMTLSVFMVFVRIFSKLLLRRVLDPWLNIWAKFMPFCMSLMSYCLRPPLQLKNLSNGQSSLCCWHYMVFLMNIPMFATRFWGLLLCPTSLLLVLPFYVCQENKSLIHLLVLMIPQSWSLSGMIAIVLASRERDDPSVTIVAN